MVTLPLYLRKFFILAVLALILGTVHGIIMSLPVAQYFLEHSGRAGHQVDPLALSHMFQVGFFSATLMALTYLAVPKVCGHPLYSIRMVNASFWFLLCGHLIMYLSWIYLGLSEWAHMSGQGMSYIEAKTAMGWKLHLIPFGGTLLAIGCGLFAFNVLLSFFTHGHDSTQIENRGL